jgi:ketosteroid isomerase-like protein
VSELLQAFYAALRRGDRAAVAGALAPDFEATFTAGLPHGIGGVHRGEDAIDRGWWTIGRHFDLEATPEEWIAGDGGRTVVLGTYRGHARATGTAVEAAFAHVWTIQDGRLRRLVQITDSARWIAS